MLILTNFLHVVFLYSIDYTQGSILVRSRFFYENQTTFSPYSCIHL